MTALALIRHGPTDWNAAGHLQGRRDIPLSNAGRAQVTAWRIPADLTAFRWHASPLTRARATAALLHNGTVTIDPRLIEMDWGAWEGPDGAPARAQARVQARTASNTGDSLDRRPPGGESMRDVQHRLAPWLAAIGAAAQPTVAVTHKGVILAIYARATGWDFTTPPPDDLSWNAVHRLTVDTTGTPTVDRLNVPL